MTRPIYLDNQSTTRVDPRVVAKMLPYFEEFYGNSGSTSHSFGWDARDAVDGARAEIAKCLNAQPREIVFTSGATESNNLALRGVAERARRRGSHLVSVATEHKAILDPLSRLSRKGFEVSLLPVRPQTDQQAGRIDLDQLVDLLRDDTALVSVMLANNEIGVIQQLAEVCEVCRPRGILVHSDATQAVGRLPVDVRQLDVDMLSFSSHKMYGPKGMGGLFVRRTAPPVRLEPQIDGGGQENGLRSGTLNVPSIIGMAEAMRLCWEEMETESVRLQGLRNRLWAGLEREIEDVTLNGPDCDDRLRLAGNLNCSFLGVDGEALMMSMREVAVSSGSACTSTNPEPSHVLRALGLDDDRVRASLRFGVGRFNTENEIDTAVQMIGDAVRRLRLLGQTS